MRPPMIWSRRGGGWSLKRELLTSGGVDNVMRDEDGDCSIAAWEYACFERYECGEQGDDAQESEGGAGESAMSVSVSDASRMVENASEYGLVDDFVPGGVWRLSPAGVGRKNPLGFLSSSSEDSSGVKAPLAEMRVARL